MQSVARPVPHDDVGIELVRDWIPRGEPKATFVLVHGLAEHSGRYERTGSLLSDAGFWVRSFDQIGAGASGGDRWDIDDWGRYHDQIRSHLDWARDQDLPLVLMGHSTGATLALEHSIAVTREGHLLVLSVPALAGGKRWQRAVARIAPKIVPTVSLPQAIEGSQLSRDPDVGQAYFADPLVHTRATIRFGAALFKAMDEVAAQAHLLRVPTLVLHGGADTLVPTESTAFLAGFPNVERRVYPDLRHEILNEPEGPEIVAEIVDWVMARIDE